MNHRMRSFLAWPELRNVRWVYLKLSSTLRAVSERLFSLLLHAYLGVLTAVEKRSKLRGQSGDVH